MSLIKERREQFKAAIHASGHWTKDSKLCDAFGISNSAKIIEQGLFTGTVNLQKAPDQNDQIILGCLLTFPPNDEVYFAICIKSEIGVVLQRLEQLKLLAEAANVAAKEAAKEVAEKTGKELKDKKPGINNNIRCFLANDGHLYLRDRDYFETMDQDLAPFSPAPVVDKIVFSIYPPSPSARRSLLAREFVGYLGSIVGHENVHEIAVWSDDATISPEMKRLPPSIPLEEIETSIKALGGYYPGGEVRRFHTALNFLQKKHFVILSGLSGTGKTQLALKYARAIHGLTVNAKDPLLFVCPVRPEWTDPTGLTGYYDVLSNRYVVPTFLEAVLVATAHRSSPVFLVLDEMNLARVEYYFSDILSCIETESDLRLHSHSVPIEGTTGTSIRAELPLPDNLYIIGTINVDETTNPISDKVLDRASVIDMSSVDVPGFLTALKGINPELEQACNECANILGKVHALMSLYGAGFGYRVAEEFIRYHAFAVETLGDDPNSVLDALMVQKVFVKLRGSEKQRPLLAALSKEAVGLTFAQKMLLRLTADLDEFGSFQATR